MTGQIKGYSTASPSTKAEITAALNVDAKNRAFRTFIQGLGIDVLVAAAITVYAIVTSPAPIVWAALAASLARTVVQSAASYVMRRWADGAVPTPLPPEPIGLPAQANDALLEPEPKPERANRPARKRAPKAH